jgi:hypothetical protein
MIIQERNTKSEGDGRLAGVVEQAIIRLSEECGSLIEIRESLAETADSPSETDQELPGKTK